MDNQCLSNSNKKEKRGQTSLVDFFAAVLIFIVIFMLFITLSDRTIRDSFLASGFSKTAALGQALTESFVGSRGIPTDWESNPTNVQAIGFATHQNYLDSSKLDAFVAMDYNLSKTKMGIPPVIDYHFIVMDANNVTLYESGMVKNSSQATLPFIRYAILGENAVKLKLVLYE